jgi:hypothetical protein
VSHYLPCSIMKFKISTGFGEINITVGGKEFDVEKKM